MSNVPALPPRVTEPLADIDRALETFVSRTVMAENLKEAVRYALLGGGKRLRPLLAWHCAAAASAGHGQGSLPAGVAVELIHAFSLVHDDLPAMDDDDLRRGRPTLHIHAGEAMAILAGDAMTVLAYMALDEVADTGVRSRLVTELSAGTLGMIDGQVYDTLGGLPEGLTQRDQLTLIHRRKTGALIRAACRMGALLGGGSDRGLAAITTYADAVGLMFQVVDDILDVTQVADHLGKRSGKDVAAGKLTFPGVLGLRVSRDIVRTLHEQAVDALAGMTAAGPLVELAGYMAVRTK